MTHELLRFSTAGSVDDGKSTLIGRLLFDSKSIFEDQLESLGKTTQRRGREGMDLSLLTDGLEAEREQGITIDVAYRYFATPKRKFIIADTPGHEQYTRNMVTGASTADMALILVDARKGILPQSRRHAYISHLLGIPHIVVCINKMDLVDYSQNRFDEIRSHFEDFVRDLNIHDLRFLPLSALNGDNVVSSSENMPWYQGQTLMQILETVDIVTSRNFVDARFPVQYVNRPNHDYRGFCGEVASGIFAVGDTITAQPGGKQSRIKRIESAGREVNEAYPPMSVTIHLEDEIDISRGDVLIGAGSSPKISQDLQAQICWMADAPLTNNGRYLIKHGSKTTKAIVKAINHKIDITNLTEQAATQLNLNEIGSVTLKAMTPLIFDAYAQNRSTGRFILIDETTNSTVGAGVLV